MSGRFRAVTPSTGTATPTGPQRLLMYIHRKNGSRKSLRFLPGLVSPIRALCPYGDISRFWHRGSTASGRNKRGAPKVSLSPSAPRVGLCWLYGILTNEVAVLVANDSETCVLVVSCIPPGATRTHFDWVPNLEYTLRFPALFELITDPTQKSDFGAHQQAICRD